MIKNLLESFVTVATIFLLIAAGIILTDLEKVKELIGQEFRRETG